MISVDFRSGLPLYRQVKDGVKKLILCGAVGENEKLPSVRELAATLAINPNTIQRAYRELEADGYIGTSPGKGVFVVGGALIKERQLEEIYTGIISGIKKLLDLGLSRDEVMEEVSARLGS